MVNTNICNLQPLNIKKQHLNFVSRGNLQLLISKKQHVNFVSREKTDELQETFCSSVSCELAQLEDPKMHELAKENEQKKCEGSFI